MRWLISVVNNAGVAFGSHIVEGPPSHAQTTFDVNIRAHFSILREFLPALIKNNHGHVVTLASLSCFFPIPLIVDYAATKAGALALHEVHYPFPFKYTAY